MPVISLRSSTLRWPRRDEVFSALEAWVRTLEIPGLLAVGVFGSYARGDYGVGSDLDLLLILNSSPHSFERRIALLPLESLPVPAEALVYTVEEWCALPRQSPRLAKTLEREAVWIWGQAGFC
ncbi:MULTISPECIES: nucleotidyltransferase domain-containing protein [unclassified Meiothermus]|uniref:nucleotidyltransferase domain-containing protein n=1 Tax=unclassified Meiothermus TaxID=370471 RepID=UPI000D7D064A|nr:MULTISPECIES: nucleotidyltransferase domain-containing protein [unclassified Meiothermus]PZA06821.1 nucleotidyltransferase domain-containing protein [Meiothermus sp. Pnk-1]RYM33102.1 nucleotidyltransferase domain-containing protein [Meiothermus sp. PNK-Is4]